jgi:cytosine/adenosine deaminase-related metal-dependent hydrolase
MAPDADLFTWLKTLYPIWARLNDAAIYSSTQLGLAELVLSGCTTSSDHLYVFPNDCTLDSQIRAAREIGVRFHAARGSMSLGASQGGLPPDSLTEREEAILSDSQRVIETYHDAKPYAMTRIVVAPCSPFSVSADLMRQSAALARTYGVRLHTHLAETLEEEAYCHERFGMRPVEYAESLGWLGDDVWHAHCVHLSQAEVERFGASKTGVAHCPSSNMRLASGIAPVLALCAAGAPLGLGVDGSASNDGSHMLAEARQALLLQRIAPVRYADNNLSKRGGFAGDPAALSARQALELATCGGAQVLGRDDIGQLAVGKAADLIAINMNRIGFSGAGHDPLAALVLCQPGNVDWALVDGKTVVEQGRLCTLETEPLRARHQALAGALLRDEL